MAQRGRPKKHTAATLRAGIDSYFGSLGRKQHPNVAGLLLHLGIYSRTTWAKYGRDKQLGPVVEYAKLRLEDHWSGVVLPKSPAAGKFYLSCGMGVDGKWAPAAPESEDDNTGVIELAQAVEVTEDA